MSENRVVRAYRRADPRCVAAQYHLRDAANILREAPTVTRSDKVLSEDEVSGVSSRLGIPLDPESFLYRLEWDSMQWEVVGPTPDWGGLVRYVSVFRATGDDSLLAEYYLGDDVTDDELMRVLSLTDPEDLVLVQDLTPDQAAYFRSRLAIPFDFDTFQYFVERAAVPLPAPGNGQRAYCGLITRQ